MPTYRYRCTQCGEEFELWQSINDDAIHTHDACGGEVLKVLTAAGIVLKGSGFYRNDSRSADKERTRAGESKAKDGAAKDGDGSSEPRSSPSGDSETGTKGGDSKPAPAKTGDSSKSKTGDSSKSPAGAAKPS
jgi:putative FmdB family regulatory protein